MSSCPALSVQTPSARPWETFYRFVRHWTMVTLGSIWILIACKAVIGCVAVLDTYLTIKYVDSLDIYELNPVGRWLMSLDDGPRADTTQIAAFIAAKFLGTVIVLIAIQGLSYWRARMAGVIAFAVACFQLTLAFHLLFSEG